MLELFASAAPGREFLPPALLEMQVHAQQEQWSQLWGEAGNAIVECDGEPVGRLWTAWGNRNARLIDIALLPHHRGRGLGSRLLDGLCAAADTAGVHVHLTVASDNVGAQALYRRKAFSVVESTGFIHAMVRPPGATTL